MKGKLTVSLMWLVILTLIASTVMVGCGPTEAPPEPAPTQPPAEQPTEAAAAPTEAPAPPEKVVNSAGVELPDDAAPLELQVLRRPITEYSWLSWAYTAYDFTWG